MNKTPLNIVKERFQTKEKLVAAVEQLATEELWLDQVSEIKGLAKVSNAKLLRLHSVLSDTKKRFGTRAKLVDAILKLEKRAKDEGFKARLEAFSLPRLLDHHSAAERREKRAEAKAKSAPKVAKKKVARSKKARAKAKKAA